MTEQEREILESVLIYHYRKDSGCGCGWGRSLEQLGRSWPEHVIEVYEQSLEAM